MLGALKFSNATAWSVLKDACNNNAEVEELKRQVAEL